MKIFPIIATTAVIAVAIAFWWPARAGESKAFATQDKAPQQPMEKVVKSDEEWKKILGNEAYQVTRKAGTERPGGPAYKEFKKQGEGTYYCVCCGNKLFTSKQKFDSGCGWPSFYDPATATGIIERADNSLGMVRVEVLCSKCDAHLGHVFEGEGFATPTDRRFCINAVALTFVPEGGEAPPAAQAPKTDEKMKP